MIKLETKGEQITTVVPQKSIFRSYVTDITEYYIIDKISHFVKSFVRRFRFIQNGNVQMYVLYGVIFILIVLASPFLYKLIVNLITVLG